MGQFLRVNGDYNIQAIADPVTGGTITLDTGPQVGKVIVTGDLQVEGATVYVAATNLDIEDNIITLNKGETGAGVTLDFSGIQVDRGSADDVSLLWDENIAIPEAQQQPSLEIGAVAGGWKLVGGGEAYTFQNSRLKLRQIITDPLTDDGNLTLIGQGTGVVSVFGTDNYEDQVIAFGNDAIPNKKYVDDAIQNNPTFQIVSENSRVIVTEKDVTGSLQYFIDTTGYNTFGESAVSILVDGVLNATFFNNRTVLGSAGNGLEFSGTEITTENSLTNENIILRTQGTGKIQTNYALQLDQVPSTPAYVFGASLLHSATPGLGTTGVFFVNDSVTERYRTGELISKNKALVFSMIF